MSNIRVDVNYTIKDGTEIKFRSPVDCSQITGLIVYYPGTNGNTVSKVFALSDAHGNNVGDIDHLFAENVVVKVILDVTTGMAFVQNADTNKYLESRINKAAPVNLLDNSDFRNPVNQRGATEKGDFGYFIDRWICYNGAYTDVSDGYIGINSVSDKNGGLIQYLPNLSFYEGKKLTLAICAKSNGGQAILSVLYVKDKTYTLNDDWNIYTLTVTYKPNNHNGIAIYAVDGSLIHVKWAALYEGEYTAETLPEYHPKGYAHELLECQRYYWRTKHYFALNGFRGTGSTRVSIDLPTCMRAVPTVTHTAPLRAFFNSTTYDNVSIVSADMYGTQLSMMVDNNTNMSIPSKNAIVVTASSDDCVLEASADL